MVTCGVSLNLSLNCTLYFINKLSSQSDWLVRTFPDPQTWFMARLFHTHGMFSLSFWMRLNSHTYISPLRDAHDLSTLCPFYSHSDSIEWFRPTDLGNQPTKPPLTNQIDLDIANRFHNAVDGETVTVE